LFEIKNYILENTWMDNIYTYVCYKIEKQLFLMLSANAQTHSFGHTLIDWAMSSTKKFIFFGK